MVCITTFVLPFNDLTACRKESFWIINLDSRSLNLIEFSWSVLAISSIPLLAIWISLFWFFAILHFSPSKLEITRAAIAKVIAFVIFVKFICDMEIKLIRDTFTAKSTTGILYDNKGNQLCYSLELPWKDNKRKESCIPEGTYKLIYLPNGSPKFQYPCFLLEGVTGRTGIMIHIINEPKDTLGCIGFGLHRATDFIGSSTKALRRIVALQPTSITITSIKQDK